MKFELNWLSGFRVLRGCLKMMTDNGRTDGRRTHANAGGIDILIAQLRAFGSGGLKCLINASIYKKYIY